MARLHLPVCEAYLQRLNTTEFHNLPACGRPENNDVPGFTWLNREWANVEESRPLSDQSIIGFLTNTKPEPDVAPEFGPFSSFRYNPPIDIDNDGVADNVLVTNYDLRKNPECGNPSRGEFRSRGSQQAVILTPDETHIDRPKTIGVFGRSKPVIRNAGLPVQNFVGEMFWPIGQYVSIFKYRNLNYFDTFYDTRGLGYFDGKSTKLTDPKLNNTLAVLLNRRGQTEEICTYYLMDDKQGK